MQSNANHIIHKQTLDIRFSDFDSAQKWIASTQVKTTEAVRRSIEHCLEDYDYTNEYLTIERLELNLGVFGTDELLSKMPEKLYSELQKILNSYHGEMNHFEDAEIIEETSPGNFSVPQVPKRKSNAVVKNSEVDAFLFFLQHSYLPWWYSNEPVWDPEWVRKLSEENWKELRNFLTAYFKKDVYYENALIRLISQFNDTFLANLLSGLQLKEPVEQAWTWLEHFYITMQKTETDFHYEGSLLPLSVLRLHFWKKWIEYALDRSAIPGLITLLAPIKQPSLVISFLLGVVKRNEWMNSVPEFWRGELTSFKPVELINHTEREKFKETEKAKPVTEDDFILIPDAGLVLLHAFLPRLLEYCGWLRENEFVNDEAKNRAVYALHYLAAGDEEAPEYVLMLPKLLCGISLESTLESALPLTDAEKAACDEMLTQVLAHWKVLRNTSLTGLREAFLWRQGKLFSTGEGWRLEVQRKTEDILMNRLPWGFSMIKFPWMPWLLSVSWE